MNRYKVFYEMSNRSDRKEMRFNANSPEEAQEKAVDVLEKRLKNGQISGYEIFSVEEYKQQDPS
jgi:hypothetical protein